jgi:hypothetical protein
LSRHCAASRPCPLQTFRFCRCIFRHTFLRRMELLLPLPALFYAWPCTKIIAFSLLAPFLVFLFSCCHDVSRNFIKLLLVLAIRSSYYLFTTATLVASKGVTGLQQQL